MLSPIPGHLSHLAPTLLSLPEDVLATRLLGATPAFCTVTQNSPLALNFYNGSMCTSMHLPECDFGQSALTPQHRRLTLFYSAKARDCAYCTRHAATCGDLVNGSLVTWVERGGEGGSLESEAEFVRVVTEAFEMGFVSDEAKMKFVERFGEKGYEELCGMAAFCGFLNFAMSALDIPVEGRLVPFADRVLEGVSLPYLTEAGIAEEGREIAEYRLQKRGGWGAFWSNWIEILTLPPAALLASVKEWLCFRHVPKSGLDEWAGNVLGVVPRFMQVAGYLKRVVALGIKEVFVAQRSRWAHEELRAFLYVFAETVGNLQLKDDAITMEEVFGEDGEKRIKERMEEAGKVFRVALEYVAECARPGAVAWEEQEKIVGTVGAKDLADLAGMIAIFAYWMRVLVMMG